MTCGSRQGTLSADMVPSTTSLLIVPGTPVTVARVTIALFAKEIGKCEQAKLHEQQSLTKTDKICKNKNTVQIVHKKLYNLNCLPRLSETFRQARCGGAVEGANEYIGRALLQRQEKSQSSRRD